MQKFFSLLAFATLSSGAHAQWAVLDQSVLDIVTKINKTEGSGSALEHFADQTKLDATFESVSLTNPEKYVGTVDHRGQVLPFA